VSAYSQGLMGYKTPNIEGMVNRRHTYEELEVKK
jgi:hypothetical protein